MRTLFNMGEQRDVSGIHNPFENPVVPLSSLALDSVYGAMSNSDAGEVVTQDTSLALPIFWRCVGLLSTVIAGCPVRTYRMPGKEEVFPSLLSMFNQNMVYTQFELWELVVAHICLWGNAYVRKVRGVGPDGPGSGKIIDLIPINPARVKVKLDEGNKIFEVTRLKGDGTLDNSKPPLILTTFEVMHIPGLGYNGTTGLSPVMLFKNTIGTSMSADRLAAKFYAKGSMLSGVIKVKAPLASQTQADAIRNRWQQKTGGVKHAAEVAVLDAETDFQPLTIAPEQLQFLESRRWQTTEIARMHGIPPHLVGDVEKSTSWGTGIETQNIGFVSYTVSGWTNRIGQRATREIISTNKQFCEFDLDRLLRGSMQERFEAYTSGITGGWLSRNEARLAENKQPKAGLDEMLIPMNMMTVSQANAQAEANVAATSNPEPDSEDDESDNSPNNDDGAGSANDQA